MKPLKRSEAVQAYFAVVTTTWYVLTVITESVSFSRNSMMHDLLNSEMWRMHSSHAKGSHLMPSSCSCKQTLDV